mmetsp:Transcript_36378/g.88438  ORF Transcript_36378/g.88438 Transcript_36378/m.88438 type:complete len:206 (+) Transcript_36378:326-943(+)
MSASSGVSVLPMSEPGTVAAVQYPFVVTPYDLEMVAIKAYQSVSKSCQCLSPDLTHSSLFSLRLASTCCTTGSPLYMAISSFEAIRGWNCLYSSLVGRTLVKCRNSFCDCASSSRSASSVSICGAGRLPVLEVNLYLLQSMSCGNRIHLRGTRSTVSPGFMSPSAAIPRTVTPEWLKKPNLMGATYPPRSPLSHCRSLSLSPSAS